MMFVYLLTYLLLKNCILLSKSEYSTSIGNEKYQKYLLTSTLLDGDHSRKFIVDILWNGIKTITNNKFEGDFCLTSLKSYILSVKNNELWALKMYDASSGNQPGFLTGNIQEIGSYDECVGINHESFSFFGKYCLANINDSLSPLQEHDSLKNVAVSYALCVPSICSARRIQELLNVGANIINSTLSFTLNEEICFTDTPKPFDFGDWLAMLIFAGLAGLSIVSTAYDIYIQPPLKGSFHNFLMAFSVRANSRSLLSVVKSRESMDVLYGLRFLTIVWIIEIHRFSQLHIAPSMGLFKWNTIIQDWSRAFIVNGYICVDTFLVISGMLLSYTFLKKVDKNPTFYLAKFYLHRYLRLTPALAGVVLFYATVSDRFCDGPQCPIYLRSIKAPCNKNWWTTLLYINNYYDSDNMCVVQTWYTSVDMQLFWLSPLLLYPLLHYRGKIYLIISCLISITFATSLIQPYLNNVSAGYFVKGKDEDHSIFLNNYVLTHTRATSWLIGFALGVYIHNYKKNSFLISKKIIFIGWFFTIAAFTGVIFGILPFQQETHQYDPLWDTLYKSLHRHIWALATCWLIFACISGYGGFINQFFSWGPVFQPLGRLTYCIYLTHLLILHLQMGAQRTPNNFTDLTRITTTFGDVMASICAAVILFLLFEAPGCALDKLILGPDKKKKQITKDVTTQ